MAPITKESSQTEVKDLSAPKLSETDPALFMEKYNKNQISLAGKVVELNVKDPQPKIDKKTKEHIKDTEGALQFWDESYSCEIIFEGGSLYMNVSKEIYSKLEIGKRFLFEGMMGLDYGKVQPKFYNATLISN